MPERLPYTELIKKECIGFIHWALSNQWEYLYWGGNKREGWHHERAYDVAPISDEQLYDLYIAEKQKQ